MVYSSGIISYQKADWLDREEVFDAECTGALEAIRWVLSRYHRARMKVYLCLDNTSVLTNLVNGAPLSSGSRFAEFRRHAAALGDRLFLHWSPGHTGIPGNEAADRCAGALSALPLPHDHPSKLRAPSLAYIRRWAKEQCKAAEHAWWAQNRPDSYANWHIGWPDRPNDLTELDLPLIEHSIDRLAYI